MISGVSIYSFVIAVICFNICLLVISFLRRNTIFLVKISTSMLLLLSLLGIIRLLLPLDMYPAVVIQSSKVIPWIKGLLGKPLFGYITLWMLMVFIWILGAVLALFKASVNLILEIQKLKKYSVVENPQLIRVAEAMQLKNAVILVSPDADVPKVIGVIKAYIYLPEISVSDDELKLILYHEYQHFKGHDLLIKVFYLILLAFFWWNPVVLVFQKEVDNLLELRCDAAITKKMNSEERLAYLHTILSVIKQTVLEEKKYQENAASLVKQNDKGFLQQRFEVIINEEKKVSKMKLATLLVIIITFTLSYFVIIQPAYYPLESDIEGFIEITVENAFILVSEDGMMELYVDGEFLDEVTEEEIKREPLSELKIFKEGD